MKYRELTKAESAKFVLALGLMAYGFAALEIFYPRVPDGSGRWGWLTLRLYENFGKYGVAGWSVVLGTFLVITYFRHRRSG